MVPDPDPDRDDPSLLSPTPGVLTVPNVRLAFSIPFKNHADILDESITDYHAVLLAWPIFGPYALMDICIGVASHASAKYPTLFKAWILE